mgnify:CR=1 FL=1|tara:strand:- start:140 stop:466 length:327 start_codon:yes stop_codon:yes gene_type:complete
MNIGTFDRMIRIEEVSASKNSFGEEVTQWVEFETVYAEKYDKVNRETFEANQLTAIVNTVFTIYYMEGINETMRVIDLDTGSIYQIVGVKEIGYKEGLQLFTYSKDRF